MKKVLKVILFISIFLLNIKVHALTVSKNNLEMSANTSENVSLLVNTDVDIKSIEFSMVYDTYDIPANFKINDIYKDNSINNNTYQINFDTPLSGEIDLGNINIKVVSDPKVSNGKINIYNAHGYTENDEYVKFDSVIVNVAVKKENTQETNNTINNNTDNNVDNNTDNSEVDYNVLQEIKSDIVKIELKKDVFEYNITIDKNIEELDLLPVAIDNSYKVEVSNQKILELGEDKEIIITVKGEDDFESIYKIKINFIKEVEEIEIDNRTFEFTKSYNNKWLLIIFCLSILMAVSLIFFKKNRS